MELSTNTVQCEHCGALVDVRGSKFPLTYVTRDLTPHDARTFLIVAEQGEQSSLLHYCTDGT